VRDGCRQRLEAIDFGRRLVHAGALLPAVWILAALARRGLTVYPHQAVEKHMGRVPLILLVASLA
jgi:DMSO/TMAO reductase YedYZ heme-binding membrane subunit